VKAVADIGAGTPKDGAPVPVLLNADVVGKADWDVVEDPPIGFGADGVEPKTLCEGVAELKAL
jgi:hypothetical protein